MTWGNRAGLRAGDDREDDERDRVRQHGRSHGRGDRRIAAQARLANRRIHDQRVRGEERAQQKRRRERPPKREADRHTADERDHEGDEAERHCSAAIFLQHLQVELEPCDEHQVEEAEVTEFGHGVVSRGDQSEPVCSDHEPAEDEADQAG
jgi:hypothetical protein